MLHFIYNPIAGKGKARQARRFLEQALRQKGIEHCFHTTEGRQDAARIARQLTQRGERDIIAVGGDGTLNEVLNGLTEPADVRLGIVPCGSGNDFAAAAGIPMDIQGALDVLLHCAPKETDYLECSGIRGLNVIGAGIDVDILRRVNRAKVLKGSLNYFASLIASLIRFRLYRFTSDRDGRRERHEGMIVCACNGRRFGGGIGICPQAELDDGQMDVVIVHNVRKRMIPGALIALVRGKILRQRYTLHEHARRLQAAFEEEATVQIDGELYEKLPFDVKIISGKLNVYRP